MAGEQLSATATGGGAGTSRKQHWVEFQHKEYRRHRGKWIVATDVYSGELIDPLKIPQYLIKRSNGESEAAFLERVGTIDFTNHFATVVDGLAGMLFAVEDEASRVTEDEEGYGLGDPLDRESDFGKLWAHATAEGEGWLMVFKQLLIALCVTHVEWLLIYTSPSGAPMVKAFNPLSVPNWREENGQIVEVLVEEDVDARGSLSDDPDVVVRQFMHYTLGGYQRYRLEKRESQGNAPGTLIVLNADGGGVEKADYGTYKFVSPRGDPALPIFRVKLPMKRDVGYLLARKLLAIFNQESARDALIRMANFPRLCLGGTRSEYEDQVAKLAQGWNVLHMSDTSKHPHAYIAPDTGSAAIANAVLERKVEEFFNSAHQAYGESAKQRTATEAKQDVAKGAGAFLNLTKQSLDDAEANCAWRIAQILHPDDPRHWFTFSVERSADFLPADPDVGMERAQKRFLGTDRAVPVGIDGKVAAAQTIVGWHGLGADDEQLTADVKSRELLDLMETGTIALTPLLQNYVLALKLVAIGKMKLDAAEKIFSEANIQSELKAALVNAEAAAEAKRREAESLPNMTKNGKLIASGGGGPNQDGGGDLTGTLASKDDGSRPDGSSRLGPRAGM